MYDDLSLDYTYDQSYDLDENYASYNNEYDDLDEGVCTRRYTKLSRTCIYALCHDRLVRDLQTQESYYMQLHFGGRCN